MYSQVQSEEGAALAAQLGCPFFETSAVFRQCVDDVFYGLVREIRRKNREAVEGVEKQNRPQSRMRRVRAFFSSLNVIKRRRAQRS
jgi:hypothetical protein